MHLHEALVFSHPNLHEVSAIMAVIMRQDIWFWRLKVIVMSSDLSPPHDQAPGQNYAAGEQDTAGEEYLAGRAVPGRF